MRKSILALSLLAATAIPAQAGSSQGFEASFGAIDLTAIDVNVTFSEEMQQRAVGKHPDFHYRSKSNSRGGFSSNDFLGERALEHLAEDLSDDMEKALSRKGVSLAENAGYTLNLVITDAKNNRPTFEQLSRQPSQSYRSFGIGGATIEGELVDASGAVIGTVSYGWYETDISWAGMGTWSDADRAFSKFASRTAKVLTGN